MIAAGGILRGSLPSTLSCVLYEPKQPEQLPKGFIYGKSPVKIDIHFVLYYCCFGLNRLVGECEEQ